MAMMSVPLLRFFMLCKAGTRGLADLLKIEEVLERRKLAVMARRPQDKSMKTETIQSMTLPEQIETMERLWDSICHAGKEQDSPAWHEDVVRERQQRYHSGEAETLSL